MKQIYLDNAATTSVRPEVVEEMVKVLRDDYGNPSSTYAIGRHAKSLIENARKTIAKQFNATSSEIIFTSCGTEANNWILRSCIRDLGVKRIISTKLEHHAVLYSINNLAEEYDVEVVFLDILPSSEIDYTQLEELLKDESQKTLVSLMHVNNEVGTELDLKHVAQLCTTYNALFHCDTVQSIGKKRIDLAELPIDFIVASAHKFHGPKGIGFAFIRKKNVLKPVIFGGEQEKGLRAGTEAAHQVVGMAKALEMAYELLDEESEHIGMLKAYCKEELCKVFPEIKFNGNEVGFYNILNVLLPLSEEKAAMMLFQLDMKGIAVSRGSACQSGSQKPSHVLSQFLCEEDLKKPSLRLSFSHENTKEEIDTLIEVLQVI
ncbi:cysteine desulfurase family protein [Myroides pelagicus]|uniref:cysteine desulfurase n=1 Tax=Myroides pelagicus TaxID=270914 RepID=A0A7K1GJK8_9FLAO|nr:cysteine desulfurase family protein [Myroides pelagicus]MEC4113831.1 cysteine desulfurase family protein [Myroides pelagicus]MTH29061.1 aminotransferase class V-fold PLP-dependent enzyme [Myroides pelagicus]